MNTFNAVIILCAMVGAASASGQYMAQADNQASGWAGQSAASPAAASYGDVDGTMGAGQMAYASQSQVNVNNPAAAFPRPAASPTFPKPLPAAPATTQMICTCISVTPVQQTPSSGCGSADQASAPAIPSGSDSSAAPAQSSYSSASTSAAASSDAQSYASPAAPAAQSYTAQFTASSPASAAFVAPAVQSYSAPATLGAQQSFSSQSSPAQQPAANNGGY